VASENLKDLAGPDSALRRLLTAVVVETNLTRIEKEADGGAGGPPKGAGKLLGKLGKLGKLAKKGVKFIPTGGGAADADTSGAPVAEHFAPIRATIEEVDGRPPGLDDAQAALAALSSVLQTVAANPNPEEALRQQGGLPELIGAVTNQAALLPDPLDTWLAGIAGEFRERQEEAVSTQLNAIWRADVLPFCQAATSGRYPFESGSRIDVNTADFQRLFGPGGMIDGFTNDYLLAFVDMGVRPWRWRADLGLKDASLVAFEQANPVATTNCRGPVPRKASAQSIQG
jgi:type VI secretion system protein ImpL